MKTDFRKICDPTDSGFRLAHSPFYLIAHADFRYHEDVSTVLEKQGVNKNMYRIMTVLREDEPAAITRLADRALIKRSTVSRIVDRMTEMGLTSTSTDEADNRVTVVELTKAGYEVLDKLTPVVAEQFRRAMVDLSSEDIETLIGLLQRIGINLTDD
ncbi:MarR family winged helix-turn-helix transcriptional regulator [Novosphingobium rosa]|uniref:MarR family winged helix-turn-helix transcriptional regulator n=1 Tax=Novosphingobium rosa TaxID=76978 RepID=UPI00082B053B|nr:MarR family transcriptional regulator [Novosphingobium rosa]